MRSAPRRRWTSFELAGRLDGMVRPERLAVVREVLQSDPRFVSGADWPDAYRLLGEGQLAPDEAQACVTALIGEAPLTPLIRVSAYPLEGRAEARFAFPRVAARLYGEALARLARETGWRIEIRPTPDQGGVQEAVLRCLPAGLSGQGTASLYLDQGRVAIAATGHASREELAAACARFKEETGYDLEIQTEAATTVSLATMDTAAGIANALEVANAKSRLSELAQALRWPLPRYHATQHGEPHRPTFQAVATLVVDGAEVSSTPVEGASKKEAEQRAARDLLALLAREGVISSP